MRKFEKIIILDKILMLRHHWEQLRSYCDELIEFSGLEPEQIMTKIQEEMEESPRPMCWTQLSQEDISKEELKERINNADCVISCWTSIPNEILLANPQLKYIGFWTNLAAHRIDLEFAKASGLFVSMIPDYGTDSVAELTFTGMLAISRRIIQTHKDTLRGSWPYELLKSGQYIPKVEDIPNKLLRNKKIGIVGLGRIGKRVAEIALAFKMDIKYWSKYRHLDWEEKGLEYKNLEELFLECDIITIHLSPYAQPQIINKFLLNNMKEEAIFINTSSGSLVDQDALFELLMSRKIHAFLDVYESLPPRKLLKQIESFDNVFTYRSGWYTREAITYKGEYLLNNINSFLNGTYQKAAWDYEIEEENLVEKQCTDPVKHD